MHMVRTPYWILERDLGAAYFRLRRTAEKFASNDLLDEAARSIERVMVGVDLSRLGFLVDLREGPMRNDPEWEKIAAPWQKKMMSSFGRVAILVKTPAGKLQMNRIVRALHATAQVFDEEKAAIEWLRSPPRQA
jgi:hypothetical protein